MADSVVMIMCVYHDRTCLQFDLPASASLRQLRQVWSEKARKSWEEHRFRFGNNALPLDGIVSDVATGLVLSLTIFPKICAQVSLLGAPRKRCAIDVSENTTVDDVMRAARVTLGIEDRRRSRLLLDDMALSPEQRAQQVVLGSGARLLLDLEVTCVIDVISATVPQLDLELDAHRAETRRLQKHAFCSQRAGSLLQSNEANLFLGEKRVVAPSEPLSSLVSEREIIDGYPLVFFLQIPFPILVERRSGVQEWQIAWPLNPAGSLTQNRLCDLDDGEPIPRDQLLGQVGLLEHSCVRETQASLRLCVLAPGRQPYWVQVDPQASGFDLRNAVEQVTFCFMTEG